MAEELLALVADLEGARLRRHLDHAVAQATTAVPAEAPLVRGVLAPGALALAGDLDLLALGARDGSAAPTVCSPPSSPRSPPRHRTRR